MSKDPHRDALEAALARVDALEQENSRLWLDANYLTALLSQND